MMKVLSLFDGISACHLALTRAGFEVDTYYTSEIDKYATQISEKNYPDAIRLGDVTNWKDWDIDWSSIDLVTGGFPCQAWSVAGKQLGDKDPRGMLFWTMLDVMKMVLKHNPKAKFLIENVKMKKEFEEYITHHTEQALGHVEKHLINSALVSAQNRQRYYWSNIQGITQPEDKGLVLADVIESDFVDRDKAHCLDANYFKGGNLKSYFEKNRRQIVFKCGAMRGRYIVDGNRADHTVDSMAGKTEQRIECRGDDKTNALTTVQKDNLLIQVGSLYKNNGDARRIYHPAGKGRTLKGEAGGGGAKMGLLACNTLIVPEATKKGYVEIEPNQCVDLTFPNSKTRRGRKMVDKSNCLTAANHEYSHWNGFSYRKLTPVECERLQTFPDGWTEGVSNTQRYKALGNAWTVDVIEHIFSFIKVKAEVITLDKGLFIPAGTQLELELFEEVNKVAVA